MKHMTRITNVSIKDIMEILSELAKKYDLIDIVICPEDRKVIIDPVDHDDIELTDENIYDLI